MAEEATYNTENGSTTDKYEIKYIENLVGIPTSLLANVHDMYGEVPRNTEFLVSHSVSQSIEDVDDVIVYEDAKLNYDQLSARIYEDIPTSEMMMKEQNEFAFCSHSHPEYSWFKAWPDFGPNGKNKANEISGVLATVSFTNNKQKNVVDICLPKIDYDDKSLVKPKHLIGELMFIAEGTDIEKQLNGVVDDVYAENFSGWVHPNGQTIKTKRYDFIEAKTAFGATQTSLTFTVPNIEGFLKPVGDQTNQTILKKLPGYNNVPVHSHDSVTFSTATPSIVQVKSTKIAIKNGRGSHGSLLSDDDIERTSKYGVICPWPNPSDIDLPAARPAGYKEITDEEQRIFSILYNDKDVTFDNDRKELECKITNLSILPAGMQYDESDELHTMSWPKHTVMPILLYIGFPDNSKYKYWE